MNFYEIMKEKQGVPSDINQHLETLYRYACDSETIVELGTRYLISTYSFLAAKPSKMWSIDVQRPDSDIWGDNRCLNFDQILEEANRQGIDYKFLPEDSRTVEIDEESIDLLFVDTEHIDTVVEAELEHWGHKVNKYIIFHDTVLYGYDGYGSPKVPGRGINQSIDGFRAKNPHWVEAERFYHNNGLLVLKNTKVIT